MEPAPGGGALRLALDIEPIAVDPSKPRPLALRECAAAGQTTREAIAQLSKEGVKLNVTAVFTKPQIDGLLPCFTDGVPAIVSIFAGRIADAGVDPQPTVRYCVEAFKSKPAVETLWASCREIFSVVRAAEVGCHVITVPNDMLKKLEMFGKDLGEISLDTVKMFYNDATSSGFQL